MKLDHWGGEKLDHSRNGSTLSSRRVGAAGAEPCGARQGDAVGA